MLQGKRRGYIIADKYILLEHLGAGGMGSVWLCQHRVMRRRVAIKVLPTAYAKDPEFYAFYRSMQAYERALGKDSDLLVLTPDGDFFRYLKDPAKAPAPRR